MPGPRLLKLYDRNAFPADAGTITIPIKRTHQISDLILEVRCTNGGTNNGVDAAEQESIPLAIERMRLQSGSKVYYDTTGEMCTLIDTYRNGKYPAELWSQAGAIPQEATFPMHFGEDNGDDQMLLPAPLLDSLDLVIDYTFTISATAGFATGTGAYSIYAWVWPSEPVPTMEDKAFYVTTKKHDWTTLAAGDHNFDLTLDERMMLSRIYCWCYEHAIGEGVNITDVGLKIDSELVAEASWCELQKQNANDCRLNFCRNLHTDAVTANDTIWTRIPDVDPLFSSYAIAAGADYINTVTGGDVDMVSAANALGLLSCRSERIPGMVVLDFDRNHSLRHLQPQGVRDIDFYVTQGAAGGDVDVLEQSVMKYW